MLTASAHIITAVIGSGVLSLAWAIAQLGWIAGPIALMAFSIITWFTSILLADCYRSSDGTRNYTYQSVVKSYLGKILFFNLIIINYYYYYYLLFIVLVAPVQEEDKTSFVVQLNIATWLVHQQDTQSQHPLAWCKNTLDQSYIHKLNDAFNLKIAALNISFVSYLSVSINSYFLNPLYLLNYSNSLNSTFNDTK